MKLLFFLLVILLHLTAFSQSKQDYQWLFGFDAGHVGNGVRIDFNHNPLEPGLGRNGQNFDNFNCSVSNENGELLFFSNGCEIANKDGDMMPGGDSLNYDKYHRLGWSCRNGYPGHQNCLILSDPAYDQGYYLLHKTWLRDSINFDLSMELRHSYIDMALDEGRGAVVFKEVPLYEDDDILSSYLTAIQHVNEEDWWIVQPKEENDSFLIYKIDRNGIFREQNQASEIFFSRELSSAAGTASFSPDGKRYALYNYNDQLNIYDFDRNSGKLSNHQHIEIYNEIDVELRWFASVEWSSDSRFIYTASSEHIHQVDTWEADIQDGVRRVATYNGGMDPLRTKFFSMILGPDCRIYIAPTNGTNSYHVIHKPNELGEACKVVQNGVKLPALAGAGGMPNFPRYRVDEADKCDPDIVSAFGPDVLWRKDLTVFPVPTAGQITVELPEGKSGILKIISIAGEEVESYRMPSYERQFQTDLSGLPVGNYLIEFYPDDNKEREYWSRWVARVE